MDAPLSMAVYDEDYGYEWDEFGDAPDDFDDHPDPVMVPVRSASSVAAAASRAPEMLFKSAPEMLFDPTAADAAHHTDNGEDDFRPTDFSYRSNVRKWDRPADGSAAPRDAKLEAEIFAGGASQGINFDKYDDIPVELSGAPAPPPIDSVRRAEESHCDIGKMCFLVLFCAFLAIKCAILDTIVTVFCDFYIQFSPFSPLF